MHLPVQLPDAHSGKVEARNQAIIPSSALGGHDVTT